MTRALLLFCGVLTVSALTAPATSRLAAQDAPDRVFFDSLLADLRRAGNAGQIPPATRCATRTGSAERLCQALLGARRAEYSLEAGEANKARELAERVVLDQPKWPVGWYGLAMARVQATRANVMSREGPLQPLGTSNDYGAGLALIRAISFDSTFTDAIEALAMIPVPREGATRLGERIQALRGLRDRLSGMGRYGAGLLEYENNSPDSAVVWFRDALRDPTVDRGMVRLALARAYYRLGQPVNGRPVLFAGAADTSAASRLAYRQFLAWVASPAEMAEWDALKPGEHLAWFTAFWSNRDAAEGMTDGARLSEHFRRFEFALKNYPIRELQQGQQSVSSQARKVDYSRDELSARYFAELRMKIEAATADTVYPTGLMMSAALAKGSYQAPFRSFRGLRDRLDDRGVVYVRYGAPDKKEEVPDDGGAALWLYNLPDGPLFVAFRAEEFTGNSGPTRMVPHLMDLPATARNKFCAMRPTLCGGEDAASVSAALTAGGGQVTRAAGTTSQVTMGEAAQDAAIIRREAEDGLRFIERATTRESFRRGFAKPLNPAVQVLALDQLAGGQPRLTLAFAIPGQQLAYTLPPEAKGSAVYQVDIRLALVRGFDGKRIESDTTRVFASAKPIAEGEFLSGIAEFPVIPATYTGSVIISQETGQGAVIHLRQITVPEEGATLSMSDVVLGQPGGIVWNSGTSRVALNPLGTFKKGSDANVYFQLRGLVPGQPYDLTFDYYRVTGDVSRPAFSTTLKETPTAARMEVTKTLSFPNLDAGAYRVVVTVKGGGQTTSATASLTIVKP